MLKLLGASSPSLGPTLGYLGCPHPGQWHSHPFRKCQHRAAADMLKGGLKDVTLASFKIMWQRTVTSKIVPLSHHASKDIRAAIHLDTCWYSSSLCILLLSSSCPRSSSYSSSSSSCSSSICKPLLFCSLCNIFLLRSFAYHIDDAMSENMNDLSGAFSHSSTFASIHKAANCYTRATRTSRCHVRQGHTATRHSTAAKTKGALPSPRGLARFSMANGNTQNH